MATSIVSINQSLSLHLSRDLHKGLDHHPGIVYTEICELCCLNVLFASLLPLLDGTIRKQRYV